MKRLIALIAVMFVVSSTPVSAETVRTCSSVYGGGEVCGESTTTIVSHTVIETGDGDNQTLKILASIAGFAIFTTLLYKLTYKSYILG